MSDIAWLIAVVIFGLLTYCLWIDRRERD